jgi:hypothetical protein
VQDHVLEETGVADSVKYHAAITLQKTVRMFLRYSQYKRHVHARKAAAAAQLKVIANTATTLLRCKTTYNKTESILYEIQIIM